MCVVVVASCYSPAPPGGPACLVDDDCPQPQVCSVLTNTCQAVQQSCADVDPTCPPNDLAAGAIDVTAGGTFSANLVHAHDDDGPGATPGCGDAGGRDVFYQVTVPSAEVFYFDTFGSSFASVIRVYPAACANLAGTTASCSEATCATAQSQLAVHLAAGTSCIVVDQASSAEQTGDLTLLVIPGGRDGKPLAQGAAVATGDTCSSTNVDEPLDQNCDGPGNGGRDDGYFFTTCPGAMELLDANTCTDTTWDTVLYVHRITGEQLGCDDDSCGTDQSTFEKAPISGAVLYWLIVDGFDSTECGPYTLTTNLR